MKNEVGSTCLNCDVSLPDDMPYPGLYCSSLCSKMAEIIRYCRRVRRDGRIEQPDIQAAIADMTSGAVSLLWDPALGNESWRVKNFHERVDAAEPMRQCDDELRWSNLWRDVARRRMRR